MASEELPALLIRTVEVLQRLGLPDDPVVREVDGFISGPVVLGIAGVRARGRQELADGLKEALGQIILRSDIPEAELTSALVDAIVLATPCDAALSGKELETIRAARALNRPVSVVVTDAELLGADRTTGEVEIESHRLRPLLGPEGVGWHFRAKGEPFDADAQLVKSMLAPGTTHLHGKPAADALACALDRAEAAFQERCQRRDRERETLRRAEAQGALDLAQLSETEKVERLRIGDRLRTAFEAVLAAADSTAGSLSAWARSGAQGDASDAIATLEEAWESFGKELSAAPRGAFERLTDEARRLWLRVSDAATALGVDLPHDNSKEGTPSLPEDLAEIGRRIGDTSIRDLIQAAIKIAREAGATDSLQVPGKATGTPTSRRTPAAPDEPAEARERLGNVVRRAAAVLAQPLAPAERVRGHLVQGIRSRIEIRLTTYVDKLAQFFRAQAEPRLSAWQKHRSDTVDRIRTSLSERYAWSPALGDLQLLRQKIDDYRRTW